MPGIYWLLYVYVFIFGSCIGSFLNVAAMRSVEGRSFVKGRSGCPKCGATLGVLELIPVFSYIFLRGKCRHCHNRISPRYLIVELISGALFVLNFWWYDFSLPAVTACIIAALIICVFLIDLDTMTIPNGLILSFILPALLDLCETGLTGIWERVIGLFIISVPMFILSKIIKDSFGGGDIKLLAVCGFILGYKAIVLAVFISIVLCGIVSSLLLILKKVGKKDHIAFGPFLAIGIYISRLFYIPMISWYLSLFNL